MRSRPVRILLCLLAASFPGAGCSERCIRHSDCPSGTSCSAGACVVKGPDMGPAQTVPALDLSAPVLTEADLAEPDVRGGD